MVEVDRRPPKKTPIKMASGGSAKKEKGEESKKEPGNEVEEGEGEAGGAPKCGAGDGDDVRETSC